MLFKKRVFKLLSLNFFLQLSSSSTFKALTLVLSSPHKHCARSVRIRSYYGPHFPAFRLNMEKNSLSLYSVRMQEKTDQNNSEYRYFSRSKVLKPLFFSPLALFNLYMINHIISKVFFHCHCNKVDLYVVILRLACSY